MLNRRDQKGRFRYEKYLRVWNYYVAEPHLTTNIWEPGVKRLFEEPYAGNPHVRFREGQ